MDDDMCAPLGFACFLRREDVVKYMLKSATDFVSGDDIKAPRRLEGFK